MTDARPAAYEPSASIRPISGAVRNNGTRRICARGELQRMRRPRRPGRGRRCVAKTLVIRSKVRSGAGSLRAALRAHLGPTVTVALKRQLPPGRRRDGAGPRWSCRHRRHVVGRLDGGAAALGSSPLAGRPPAAALSGFDRCCHNVSLVGGWGGIFGLEPITLLLY